GTQIGFTEKNPYKLIIRILLADIKPNSSALQKSFLLVSEWGTYKNPPLERRDFD
ncbi:hypothetical protein KI387_039543, partial [Taxus chinensis]